MKKIIFTGQILFLVATGGNAWAQTAAKSSIDLDINQIRARHMLNGDMWYTPGTNLPGLEFPKGTNKHASFAGGLWISALDNAGEIRAAATLFSIHGFDFVPGVLNADDSITKASSDNWDRFWKVEATTIVDFIADYKKGGAAAITDIKYDVIKQWPAAGNVDAKGSAGASLPELLSVVSDPQYFAPFVDANSDGKYNWKDGDYPKIKGDQMLWYSIADNGPAHIISKSPALKVEVHIAAYAYKRYSAVDRMLFYEYTVHNKSDQNYTNFRLGNWSDADLGNPSDDYIAVDSSHRMAIEFNAEIDGPNGANTYGAHAPITGFSIVEEPGDTYPGAMKSLGSMTTFEGTAIGPLKDPGNKEDFSNYMNGKDAQGNPFPMKQSEVPLIYITYPLVDVCDSIWKYGRDRRYIINSNGFNLDAGKSAKVAMVFMVTDTNGHICPDLKMKELFDLADTAWKVYYNPLPLSNREISIAKSKLEIFPNPAHTTLYVTMPNSNKANAITVTDALGRSIAVPTIKNADKFELNISALANGIYSIMLSDGENAYTQNFIKD